MKKLVFPIIIAVVAISGKANAQVGINTANPTSTLDVTAKNATGSTKNVDGLLVPRVDRERAQNMAAVPTSTLIYVNGVATGTQAGTAVNIDTVGYYYFNGTAWAKLSSSAAADINIYKDDGTLTGNRTVTQADKTLAFTGTATNAFSVDGNTFSVDAANDKVGIGTTTPGVKLDVAQAMGTSEATQLRILNTSPVAANNTAFMGFNSYGGGGASWGIGSIQNSTNPSDNKFQIAYSGGAAYDKFVTIKPSVIGAGSAPLFGIGTTNPNNRLDLGTSLGSSITDVAGKKLAVYNAADGTDFYGIGISAASLQFHAASTASEAPGMVLTGNGSVGIGAAANVPTNTLDVAGTARVRTINAAASGATVLTPVYADATGVLQKVATSTVGQYTSSNTGLIGAGTNSTLISGLADGGVYRLTVIVGDPCANTTVTEFQVINFNGNNNYNIKAISGFLSGGTNKSPTIYENAQATGLTWPGYANCVLSGSGSIALNYTVRMPSLGTVTISNDSNVSNVYYVSAVRIY